MTGATIATVCLGGPLQHRVDAAAAAGFTGLELFENDLLTSDLSPEEVRDRCTRLGMKVEMYQPFRDLDSAVPEVFERNLRRAAGKFSMMQRLGTTTLLVVSGVGPDSVDDPVVLGAQLARLGDLAARHGMRIAFEALAWGRHVNTWQASWDAVRAADHPAVGLCVDSFHILARGDDPSGLADVPGEKIFSVQLADAPRLPMDVLHWSRHHRLFPGEGDLAVGDVVRAVTAAGFDGPLSLEVFNDIYRQSDPFPTAIAARESLRSLTRPAAVAGTWAEVPTVAGVLEQARPWLRDSDRIDHVVLPAPVEEQPRVIRELRDRGLQTTVAAELPGEFGLVRWQPLTSPDRTLRVVVTGPLVRDGRYAADFTVPAMVAVAVPDLLSVATELARSGVPLVEVTGNYYDDLACRAELPPALLARIRSARVLYDLDHTGALLHCSTPVLPTGVVLRWVQRIGGHQGYGEATLPMQVAALHRTAARTGLRSSA